MTDKSGSTAGFGTSQLGEKPVVSTIATRDNAEAVARTILRANQRGHDVLVTHYGDRDIDAVRFAEQLDATVVDPTLPDPDADQLRERLAATARVRSSAGMIFQPETADRIDYTETLAAFDDDIFGVEAVHTHAADSDAEVVVGIPAYNEASTIADVVSEATSHADVVVVVDDGSEDDTARVAQAAGARVVEHDCNRGYGAALKTLFEETDRRNPDHLVVLDADGQHDPADVPELVDCQVASGSEVVIGSRFTEGAETNAPLYRRFGLRVVNALTNVSMGIVRPKSRIKDTQSGFRAYDSTAVASLADDETLGDRMSASTDILYHAHDRDYRIEEVGTTVEYDVESANQHHPISHGVTLVSNILRTIETERPLTAVGLPGAMALCIGLGFAYWTVRNYVRTDIFPRGLATISIGFVLVGTFACFTAIILHALNQHFDTQYTT